MALELVAHAIVPRGGTVAVEAIGYRPAWAAFRRCGARVVPVPVDAHGIVVAALAPLVRDGLSLVYVTPHHQYPTTATLTPSRRAALLDLARHEKFAIVEDDYDHELHYDGRPILPLASADPAGHVVYIGTLSKVLAPALRLGYVLAPEPFIERLARDRFVLDRQGDHIVERATAELIEDGSVARHVRKCRQIYGARRDQLVAGLLRELGGRVRVRAPSGGMALWAEVDLPAKEVARWESRGLDAGVSFAAGARFTFDGRPIPFARFGFAMLDEKEIDLALDRLVKAFPTRA
jgi:GntR family transcriptional regulator/MocR family aminotransferase